MTEGKFSIADDDKKTVEDAVSETIKWLDANQQAEVEEFNYHREELEKTWNPIVTKAMSGGGGAGGTPGGGMPGEAPFGQQPPPPSSGPTVEEVD